MIGYLAVLAAGYVMGTKAGRDRYEQLVGTYRAVTSNPATKSMIDAGRRKIADRNCRATAGQDERHDGGGVDSSFASSSLMLSSRDSSSFRHDRSQFVFFAEWLI